MKIKHRIFIHGGWVIGWSLFILYLTLSPQAPNTGWLLYNFPAIDKLVHFTMFFIWADLIHLYLLEKRGLQRAWLIVLLSGLTFSALTEYIQGHLPYRSADIIDFTFDSLGLIAGIFLTFLLKKNQ